MVAVSMEDLSLVLLQETGSEAITGTGLETDQLQHLSEERVNGNRGLQISYNLLDGVVRCVA